MLTPQELQDLKDSGAFHHFTLNYEVAIASAFVSPVANTEAANLPRVVEVDTMGGVMEYGTDDWVIIDEDDNQFPCFDEVFSEVYYPEY